MTSSEIAAAVAALVAESFELPPERVTPAARLREDLQLDSLDGVDLVVGIEKRFAIRVDDDAADRMRTVGEVSAYVEAALASKAS
ncbi:MAG TPA: acyl carrier protein [Myxococcales bacterium]|nr:acyl carrier protein [Myxococcales bacterium]